MSRNDWLPEFGENGELETFYRELQEDILDVAYDENKGNAPNSAIWEVVIREGLYQNLRENPSVAIGFLLTTAHGPISQYKEYLDLANEHSDVIVLVALSALVNDAVHRKGEYLSDKIKPRQFTSKQSLGDMAESSKIEKRDRARELLSQIILEIPETELIKNKARLAKYDVGLYDNPLIDYFNTDENLKFLFIAQSYGFSVGKKEDQINPSGDGCAYHAITDKRLLSVVGKKNSYDRALSIPLASIVDVKVHRGWLKDRITLTTKRGDVNGPYHIWIPDIDNPYNESVILAHLEG